MIKKKKNKKEYKVIFLNVLEVKSNSKSYSFRGLWVIWASMCTNKYLECIWYRHSK